MGPLDHLLAANRAWAADVTRQDPQFFARLAQQQAPQYLWIGCSDSRVPANQIVGLPPGEMFVHRNVANVVVHADLNCLSAIQFAVDMLKVRHVIVCGHYGCSGVLAALRDDRLGLADNWLRHVQDVRWKHEQKLAPLAFEERHRQLCELNVREQVVNVRQTTVVREAESRGQAVSVHGWIYDIRDGLLHDLRWKHEQKLAPLAFEERHRQLCELNVREQVVNVRQTTVVREAENRGQAVSVHGWIYDIRDGLLHDLRC